MDYKEKVIALLNDQELSKEQKEKLENIFPELKENESEDERIKKTLKEFVKGYSAFINGQWRLGDFTVNRLIDWLEKQGEFNDNIITRDDEILQAISIGLTDVVEDAGWSDFGGIPIEEIQDWLEKQGSLNTFEVSETSIKDAEEVTSRMQYIEDDMKPIAEFIINYANWNLHKDEWNQPTLTVPLFRVLDALIQRGKPYGECVQSIEEQGEKKPVDKVEPKFKAGNWYQCTKNFFGKGVTFDKNTAYYCAIEGCLLDGCHIAIVKDLYDSFKLWTIQDAKDGDVLLEEETGEPFIYNGNRATYFSGYFLGAYCGIYNGEFNPYGNIHHWGKNSCPATKEQRDLLFQKMKEAGYEWDSEKKELKKIEPKFKPGDYIVFNGLILHIDEVVNGYYRTTSRGDGIHNSYDWDIDNAARLWTIQEAKDGDVLTANNYVFIYAHRKQMYPIAIVYCSVDSDGNFYVDDEFAYTEKGKSIHPATKEQRDLLFQRMKEAGYEWDADKKELRKIEPKTLDADDILPYLGNNQVQDILEDMGMLDDNGQCPHTAEEIFKAGMEHAYNLNREAASSVKLDAKNR